MSLYHAIFFVYGDNLGGVRRDLDIVIRGVARIFGLGGADGTMSGGARPCEYRSCEVHAGCLGPPP